jgi:transposase
MGPKKTRRAYDREFKDGAVRMVLEQGRPVSEVAKDLGLRTDHLYKWIRVAETEGQEGATTGRDKQPEADAELRKLREENRLLKMERDILKKTIAFFAERPK